MFGVIVWMHPADPRPMVSYIYEVMADALAVLRWLRLRAPVCSVVTYLPQETPWGLP
jgi:hypothetical protein